MPSLLDLTHLSTPDLEATSKAIEAGRLAGALTLQKLAAVGLGIDKHAMLAAVADLDASRLAPALAAVLAERRRRPPPIELVWTGPEPLHATTRDTRRVLEHLFRAARARVLIAGFSFDHGEELFAPLAQAMSTHGVICDVFFDVPGDQLQTSVDDEQPVVSAHARAFLERNWPWRLRPRFFYDPRRFDPTVLASLHAKCVVVDDTTAYVTSANFTDRGQTRNTEVGALLHDPHFAAQLAGHFRRCAHEGLFRQVPVAWLPPEPEEPAP